MAKAYGQTPWQIANVAAGEYGFNLMAYQEGMKEEIEAHEQAQRQRR